MTCTHDRLDPLGPFAKYNNLPEEGECDKEERVESVAQSYMSHFAKVFGRRVREVREEEFEFALERDEHAESLKKGLKIDVEEHERVVTKIKVDGKLVVYLKTSLSLKQWNPFATLLQSVLANVCMM